MESCCRHLTETGFGSFLFLVLWRIAFLAHRLAAHFDAVGVVNQTVQDACSSPKRYATP
jgi:hypothetical protein